ncbi:MAG TPA: hypothetical protein DF296_04470 [Candidatus Margulisbacteria bacterium]|nr:MAG: hypothetical protein A2X43_04465 [Candidatus Margulisbacteria bacterium GWD2_39_127]OGI04129.1 MAG: hypothetical protein A2X42_04700 [Candidatus Margulisbacteria bacterium GWF2_38_17]OGI05980.1 MAG: hypothetical protein A2X41_12210 [Candidatus Margulisbacteria bacterium GWE2_39_32]HAR63384.1 hypothetical protein [Candidatus Margulisiibacteriota bacterium]HCT84437.1 hypothetical protein [Candidatus Margulisiibacteriota bacterium]
MYLDSHLHLTNLKDPVTIDSFMAEAMHRLVSPFFCNSALPEDWELLSGLAGRHESIFPFYGVHPWYAHTVDHQVAGTLKIYLADVPSGIGEIGLDRSPRAGAYYERQKSIFALQLDIATELHKPFVLHCVRAWGDILDILRARDFGGVPFMVHGFQGSVEVARALLDLGAYVSFSPRAITNDSSVTRMNICFVPNDRILIETDNTFNDNGKSCIDEYFVCLTEAYRIIAEIKGISLDTLKKAVNKNGSIFANATYARKREA